MFQVYFDDSGSANEPIITMAGFVARTESWAELEPIYDEVLVRYEVPILHAKEFHATKGAFAHWQRYKKKALVTELFQSSKGRVLFGLSFSVRKASFAKRKEDMA